MEMVESDKSESWELEWLLEPRGRLRLFICIEEEDWSDS